MNIGKKYFNQSVSFKNLNRIKLKKIISMLITLLLFFSYIVFIVDLVDAETFGDTTTRSSEYTLADSSTEKMFGLVATPSSNGIANFISARLIGVVPTTTPVQCALYTQADMTFYASTVEVDYDGTDDWIIFNFEDQIDVYQGTTYVICIYACKDGLVGRNDVVKIKYQSTGSHTIFFETCNDYNNWESIWSGYTTDTSAEASIYCNYTEISSSNPVTINFAGNPGDIGGPFFIPSLENGTVSSTTPPYCQDGYYTNNSHQSEDWILINVSVNINPSLIKSLELCWYNASTDIWDNDTGYDFTKSGIYYYFNTSGVITVNNTHKYTFAVNLTDTSDFSYIVNWTKKGLNCENTTRYVYFGAESSMNISYTPLYHYQALPVVNVTRYSENSTYPLDALEYDQGWGETLNDTGLAKFEIPNDTVAETFCGSWVSSWYNNGSNVEDITVTNVGIHFWISSNNYDAPISMIAFDKSRSKGTYIGEAGEGNNFTLNPDDAVSNIVYNNSLIVQSTYLNDTYLLFSRVFILNESMSFTDNSIFEFSYHIVTSGGEPSLICNRSFISCIYLDVPDNDTLNSTDWSGIGGFVGDKDGDGLSDWEEWYITHTIPDLVDTDGDGRSDYDEYIYGSDPNNYNNTIYYVSTTGSNSNDGSAPDDSHAWLTIQYAMDNIGIGDVVCIRGGVYNPGLDGCYMEYNSGTASYPITFTNYIGETPIIDLENYSLTGDWYGAFELYECSYININGLVVRNVGDINRSAGIVVTGETCNNIHITNCTVYHIGLCGIMVGTSWDNDTDTLCHDIWIENNTVSDCNNNESWEAISLSHVYNFHVNHNWVHDTFKAGIDVKCGCHDGEISYNHVETNATENDEAPNLYIDCFGYDTYNVEIYGNYVKQLNGYNNYPFSLGFETATSANMYNINIYNNVFHSYEYGGYRYAFFTYAENTDSTCEVKVYNNVVIGLVDCTMHSVDDSASIFRNNIVIDGITTTGTKDHNYEDSSPGWVGGSNPSTIEGFNLTVSSVCIDNGTTTGLPVGAYTDYWGNSRTISPDIGIYEYFNTALVLTLNSCTPTSGIADYTVFYFNITWTDINDDNPTLSGAYLKVNISRSGWNTNVSMIWFSGNNNTGAIYTYNTTLSAGSYTYHFWGCDGNGGYDDSGDHSNPTVSSQSLSFDVTMSSLSNQFDFKQWTLTYTGVGFTTEYNISEDNQTGVLPALEISNTGNVPLNFSMYWLSTPGSGISMKYNYSDSPPNPGINTIATSPSETQIITNLGISSSEEIWLYMDFIDVEAGSGSQDIRIKSELYES